jgi:putative redox protein
MEVKVNWQGRLTFTGMADSGFTLTLGSEPEVGGDNDGFRPMELIAIGLAGCTAMDVISILSKKRQEITDFEVQVHAKRATQYPKVFTQAVIEYRVTGHHLDETAVVRAIELSATRYCPAQAMLGKVMPIELQYRIFEDDGDGKRTLAKSGVYTVPEGQEVG